MNDSNGPRAARARSRYGDVLVVADLVLVGMVALLSVLIAVSVGRFGGPTVLRVPLGFAFAFLLPGYAVAAALFPRTHVNVRGVAIEVGGLERTVLAVGLSVFITPLSNLVLTLLAVDLTVQAVLGAICSITLLAAAIAAIRRYRLLVAADVWRPQFAGYGARGIDFALENRANMLLSALIVLSVVGVGAAIATPENGEQYTEFAIVPPEADAAGYQTELEPGETAAVATEIRNQEGSTTDYTVVVLLQDVEFDGDTPSVSNVRELDRASLSLEPGEARTVEHQYSASTVDDDLRVTVLLYKDSVPVEPTVSNAYRAVHVSFAVDDTTSDLRPADVELRTAPRLATRS